MKATKRIKGHRRRWFEMYEETKRYIEEMRAKWRSIPGGRRLDMLRLPSDFVCFHSSKMVPIEERIHKVVVTAMARPKGALEYCMLEVDRFILQRRNSLFLG